MNEGDRAPHFELRNQDGELVRLSDYAGHRVVLYFYPKADTPGCTTQACGIRDHFGDYEGSGAVVLGVSPDPPEALRGFADKYGLPFTLLADVGGALAARYGVWKQKEREGRTYWGNERTTFLIDDQGRIERAFHNVSPATHDELLLEALGERER
jgi:thioredoxin-dependent peroxiredoxin